MTIKRNSKDELVITLSGKVDPVVVQNALDYLLYLELTAGSKATPKQADALAKDAKRNWWKKNGKRFLS